MQSNIVKEHPFGSAVSNILRYTHTDTDPVTFIYVLNMQYFLSLLVSPPDLLNIIVQLKKNYLAQVLIIMTYAVLSINSRNEATLSRVKLLSWIFLKL